ncbi:MAG TPA: LamG domain-containing protein [Planctomycetota bacterium]|nr:LamG domain-containing protein [Planctomycetota bacterium]
MTRSRRPVPVTALGLAAIVAALMTGGASAGEPAPAPAPEPAPAPVPVPAPTPVAAALPPLAAWWKLDEGQGEAVADSSGNGLAGVLRGAKGRPVWVRTPTGAALSFGGVDGIVEFKTSFADLKLPFSICLLVRPAAKQVQYADILGDHGEPFVGMVMQQDGDKAGVFGFGYGTGKEWQGTKVVQLKVEAWQHVAVVCDGENAIFYLNGDEASRSPAKGPFAANAKLPFRLGQGYAAGRYFNGALSDVRIYRGALPAAAVAELARAARPLTGEPGKPPPAEGGPKPAPPGPIEGDF